MTEEADLRDYITGLLQGPAYARLLHKRLFLATITDVQPGAQNTGYLCKVQRPGESGSDGNQYLTISQSYYPQVGDVVECMWRDANVAMILGPVNTARKTGAMTKIGEIDIDQTVNTATFADIVQTFTHLMAVIVGKCDQNATVNDLLGYMNGVSTGSSYAALTIDQTDAAAITGTIVTSYGVWPWLGLVTGTQTIAPGSSSLLFPGYTTSLYKQVICEAGAGGNGHVYHRRRINNAAIQQPITSLTFGPSGANFVAGTVLTLYGIP